MRVARWAIVWPPGEARSGVGWRTSATSAPEPPGIAGSLAALGRRRRAGGLPDRREPGRWWWRPRRRRAAADPITIPTAIGIAGTSASSPAMPSVAQVVGGRRVHPPCPATLAQRSARRSSVRRRAPEYAVSMFGLRSKTTMVEPARALPGRDTEMPVAARHAVLGTPLKPPFPEGFEQAIVGMGCFWGAERVFWQAPGVYTTAVGYAGGITPNPTYEEVCSARTGHAEVVLVVFDPAKTSYEEILQAVLGEPRSHPGHAPGQRRRHPVPLGDLLDDRGAARDRRGVPRRLSRAPAARPATARSRPRSPRPDRSTTPRTTTSSTSRRTRGATAALGGTGRELPGWSWAWHRAGASKRGLSSRTSARRGAGQTPTCDDRPDGWPARYAGRLAAAVDAAAASVVDRGSTSDRHRTLRRVYAGSASRACSCLGTVTRRRRSARRRRAPSHGAELARCVSRAGTP